MKKLVHRLATTCFVTVALLAAQSGTAHAAQLRDSGVCRLKNTKVDHVIYSGECRITQETKDYGALITVKLGEAQEFKFGCQTDGKCQMGATDVRMEDRGNGSATFRWEDFRLDVDAD